jgi:hypothetical protein
MKFALQHHMLWSGPKEMKMPVTAGIGIKLAGCIERADEQLSIAVERQGTDD